VTPSTPPSARPSARWILPSAVSLDRVAALQEALSLPQPLCALLVARGIDDPGDARRYLRPELAHLHSPALMLDMGRAVARIVDAIRRKETILIHGDYDVDGITSTALLTRVLRALGGIVVPFVPHRVTDGYDLGDAGVRAAISAGASLVVTCDCGTSAVEPVATLNAAGVDVIITDHHLPGGPLPAALAVLNPRRPGCEYPDKDLVAGGVVFKLALMVAEAMGRDTSLVLDLLDLVALATVADVAPLRGENRVLVRHGLRRMHQSGVAGVRALVRSSRLEGKDLTAGRVGFTLAPRLNATGRVGHAMRGVDLLLTDDDGTAFGIARELEEQNRERQALDRATLDEARGMLMKIDLDRTFGIVLHGEGWHPGVIGIVASRIVEQTGRPTLLIAVNDGVGKGSGRSIPAFDLHGALTECRHHFIRFGGHRMAAGITIDPAAIPDFALEFNDLALSRLTIDNMRAERRIDIELPLTLAREDLVSALEDCEPHGIGNPGPVFLAYGVRVGTPPKRVGESGIRLRLSQDGTSMDAIAWDLVPRMGSIDWSAPMDVAYRLQQSEWQGQVRLEAQVIDVRQ
jgi:single-stranded-DNA-specific exonuclease